MNYYNRVSHWVIIANHTSYMQWRIMPLNVNDVFKFCRTIFVDVCVCTHTFHTQICKRKPKMNFTIYFHILFISENMVELTWNSTFTAIRANVRKSTIFLCVFVWGDCGGYEIEVMKTLLRKTYEILAKTQ